MSAVVRGAVGRGAVVRGAVGRGAVVRGVVGRGTAAPRPGATVGVRRRGARPLAALGLVAVLGLAACADVPGPAAAPTETSSTAPAVVAAQAEQVRGEVADRLLAARVAGDPGLVDVAATGPAALQEGLRVRLAGALPDATAEQPVPAAVVVAPQGSGWPRWFATVTDPTTAPQPAPSTGPSAPPPPGASASSPAPPPAPSPAPVSSGAVDEAAVVPELPVLEVYTSEAVRLPYRLWGRLTLLPGAVLPAFPGAEVGAVPLAGGPAPSVEPSDAASAAADEEDGEDGADGEAELLAAVSGLASRYASVMADGDASPAAAEFEPDPFVEAVRARAAAEAEAVAGVADTTVVHRPLDGVEVLYAARASGGDLLAVTAVETTVTMTVRAGSGVLRPGTELRAAAGIEETRKGLTARSVTALAFVVPAEQGALRLVAVGEGLVQASAP